ncbi:hypothetical protein JVU11DRAFT_7378 [Chiua virens]|nr:hypothetical protein JVU11DRAFT_7378 [Chiua virens]
MSSLQTYPPTQPHRIMTSAVRAHTEPAPRGFMKSVMRRYDYDLDDDGPVMTLIPPEKKITQEEQDVLDEKARKRAMKNLVNSWQERLQLISVITTFFASTEAAMLVNTKPLSSVDFGSSVLKASNACLLGALIVHVCAAILSFLGAFLLIRYKLKEATREEMIAEGIKMVNSPLGGSMHKDVERNPTNLGLRGILTNNGTVTATEAPDRKGSYPVEPPIVSANPHIEASWIIHVERILPFIESNSRTLCVPYCGGLRTRYAWYLVLCLGFTA